MQDTSSIREHMPVVDRDNESIGIVDHVEGDQIKLARDESGRHHYISTSWIQDVGDSVRLNRSVADTRAEWREA